MRSTASNSDWAWDRDDNKDPFDVWFAEYFAGFDSLAPVDDDEETEIPNPMHEIVDGQNLVERLSELYTKEMANLLSNYTALSKLDGPLLKEIGVSADEIKKALKLKIEGLKNKYWKELFDNLDKITDRLTSASREDMLKKLNATCNVDFNVDNAYAVVIWVIKNANEYIDKQVCAMFRKLSEPECVKNYKSNLKTWERDNWRYNRASGDEHSHYTLDYRVITSQYSGIFNAEYGDYDYPSNLHNNCHRIINDIFTIANNLGFGNMNESKERKRVRDV